MTILKLRGSGKHLRIDKSDTALQIHDYRSHIFTANDTTESLAGFVLDRVAFNSLLKLKDQGHEISFRKAIFYQTDFSNLTLTELDLAHAKFTQCNFYRTNFIKCNMKWAMINSDCAETLFNNCTISYANFTGAHNLTGSQIIHNKGVMEAKFIDLERLIEEAQKQKTKTKSYSSKISNLFGDNESNYNLPKHPHIPKLVQVRSLVEKIIQKQEGLSAQAQIANKLFKHIVEQGEEKFSRRIQKERVTANKQLLNR